MEEKKATPLVSPTQQAINLAGSPNTNQVPVHLQPPEPNQRQIPTQQNTEADQLHPKEVRTDDNPGLSPQDPWETSPLFYAVANYFGLEQREYNSAANKLSVIVDWAIESSNSNSIEDVLLQLRGLEDALVKPGWDERRFNHLYKYILLDAKDRAFQKAMAAYRKDGGKLINHGK